MAEVWSAAAASSIEPPRRCNASRRASSGDMPRATRSSIRSARSARSSSSASASTCAPVRSGRRKSRRTPSRSWRDRMDASSRRTRSEYRCHRVELIDERGRFGAQLEASRRRKVIVAGAAFILRDTPFRPQQIARLESVECLQQRRVGDVEPTAGSILEPTGDLESVHRPPGQRFEDEYVERALEQCHDRRSSKCLTLRYLSRRKGWKLRHRSCAGAATGKAVDKTTARSYSTETSVDAI